MRYGLIVLIFAVAFAGCVHEVQMVKIHPDCPEIPATTFKAVGLDAKAGSEIFGKIVTGETSFKLDPKIISGINQSVRDDQTTDALICASRERGELKTPEQVDHAWKKARFHRTNPTAEEALQFYRENPFPSMTLSQRKETDTQHAAAIRKLIEQGYALQADIEREYRLHHRQPDYSSKEENLVQGWNGMIHAWIHKTVSTLQGIDPILVGRFNNAQIAHNILVGESVKWNSLNNYLNARIEFLNQYLDKI
jgi:hypothetical protein